MKNPATIPMIQRTPTGLTKIKWCIETLKWAGWQYKLTEPAYDGDTGNTHTVYFFVDPDGKDQGLVAGGLRHEAEWIWMQAQISAAALLTGSTP